MASLPAIPEPCSTSSIDFGFPRGFNDIYETLEVLGTGCFSEVLRGRRRASEDDDRPNPWVAVKRIVKEKLVEDPSLIDEIELEVAIMRKVRAAECSYANKLIEAREDDSYVYLILELCEGGDLSDRLATRRESFSEPYIARITAQLLHFLTDLHRLDITHRDVKPENVLLAADGSVRVADFGLARVCGPFSVVPGVAGTPLYLAPETLKGGFCHKSELWAVGCILYLMLCGKLPFDDGNADIDKLVVRISVGNIGDLAGGCWDAVSDAAKDLVRQLLAKELWVRPTARQALDHAWIRAHAPVEAQGGQGRRPLGWTGRETYCYYMDAFTRWFDGYKFPYTRRGILP